ncbi:MAG: MFS transporter [Clostridia bacterium]|nr:MFS transporter [Clostridia bacterium]
MKEKVQNIWYKFRGYWNTPPKGYEVSYKEMSNLVVGHMGNSLHGIFTTWAGMATSVPLMVSYFKVSTGILFILGLLGTVLAFIKRPILSMVIDNSKSLNGKFRRLLVIPTIISALLLTAIPFIPQTWVSTDVLSFVIPAIPVMGIAEASQVTLTLGVLVAWLLNDAAGFVYEFVSQGLNGLKNTITSVSQERSIIASVLSFFGPWPSNIFGVAIPFIAAWFFSGGTGNVLVYRIIFPICAVLNIGFILFAYKGTKERMVAGRKYEAKVKFWEGAKALSTNKYFWLIWVFGIFNGIAAGANFFLWVCYYAVGGALGDTLIGVCNMTLGLGCGVGIFLGPILSKKFGKVKVLGVVNLFYSAAIGIQLLAYRVPILILLCTFLHLTFSSFNFYTEIMTSEALDYEQYRSGKRLDGFWNNYGGILSTIVGVFTGMLSPIFMSMAGIGFGDPIDVAFANKEKMYSAFFFTTLLAFLGSLGRIVPTLFYNLSEKKHADIVRALRLRAACENYNTGDLTDEDILNVKEIVDYYNDEKNAGKITGYLRDEYEKHTEYEAILASHTAAQKRKEEREEREKREAFLRDCELEEKRYQFVLQKAKEKQKDGSFDEEAFRADFIEKSRFLKVKEEQEKEAAASKEDGAS